MHEWWIVASYTSTLGSLSCPLVYLQLSQLRECVQDDTKDNVQSDGSDDDKEHQMEDCGDAKRVEVSVLGWPHKLQIKLYCISVVHLNIIRGIISIDIFFLYVHNSLTNKECAMNLDTHTSNKSPISPNLIMDTVH